MGQESGEMIRLDIAPGIIFDETDSGAMGRWKDGNRVRFKNGLPQSLGGWESRALTGDVPLFGVPRENHDWVAIDGAKYIAFGTEKRLYIIEEGFTVHNITPIRDSGSLTNPFSTNRDGDFDPQGSDARFFSVNDLAHNVNEGDIVTFDSFTSPVGGVEVNGDFEVLSVTDVDNYVCRSSTAATTTVNGGGGVGNFTYEITVGSGATGVSSGYGAGPYGDSTYGTPRVGSTFVTELRTWSIDNWGEDLIASPRGGGIYYWDKTLGLSARAVIIPNAPLSNLRVFVSPENRQLIALGANNGVTDDPLFVAWTDNEDFNTWLPAVDNNAGDKRLDGGSEIVTGLTTRVGILIVTDETLHIMQPIGGDEVFAFRQVADNLSIASPAAAAEANGIVYHMGVSNFYVYDGTLRVLPCPVWTRVFDPAKSADALNEEQIFGVYCSHLKNFNEVWWFYPSIGQTVNDKYVVYNYLEKIWYYGDIDRASFNDFSPFVNGPFGFGNDGTFYLHEVGVDDDGSPLGSFIESGDVLIGDGDQLMHVSKLIPDFDSLIGSVEVEIRGRKYPQSPQFIKGPYSIGPTTGQRGGRMRGRQAALRITQQGVGERWRMGAWRVRVRPDGER